MADHGITLIPGDQANQPTADPYHKKIISADGDTVTWSLPGSDDWAVIFLGESPFERSYYDAAHPQTQKIMVAPGPAHYIYLVCVNGQIAHSPYVVVS